MLRPAIVCAFVLFASCRRNTPAEPSTTTANDPGQGETVTPPTGGNSGSSVGRLTGPNVVLRTAGQPPVAVRVEVQRNEAERERGLMFRR